MEIHNADVIIKLMTYVNRDQFRIDSAYNLIDVDEKTDVKSKIAAIHASTDPLFIDVLCNSQWEAIFTALTTRKLSCVMIVIGYSSRLQPNDKFHAMLLEWQVQSDMKQLAQANHIREAVFGEEDEGDEGDTNSLENEGDTNSLEDEGDEGDDEGDEGDEEVNIDLLMEQLHQ